MRPERLPSCVTASSADMQLLQEMMLQTRSWPQHEEIAGDRWSHLDSVIAKPWGVEYRVYCDPFFDVWRLTIRAGRSTSEHCHPRKSTALICLGGSGRLRLLGEVYPFGPSDVVQLGRGVFHLIENAADEPLELIEVEMPRNKLDLVRAEDPYGRRATPYADPPSSEITVPPLIRAPMVSHARYRAGCATRRWRFELVDGDRLLSRRDATLCAALSLATSDVLHDTIIILSSTVVSSYNVDRYGVYFVVFRAD